MFCVRVLLQLPAAEFMEEIKAQAQLAIDEADVIVLVTDGRVGITNGDQDVVNILHRSKKPVIVAANKIDDINEFYNEINFMKGEFY